MGHWAVATIDRLLKGLNTGLSRVNLSLIRSDGTDPVEPARPNGQRLSPTQHELPAGAQSVLRWDHPRLMELTARYRRFDQPVTRPSQWTDDYVRHDVDLANFRADNAFLWQLRDHNTEFAHLLSAYYACRIGRSELLETLKEDGLFGAETYEFEGHTIISRDLLDSILEIDFLDRHLGLATCPGIRVMDIGAGYGRLAHRLSQAIPTLAVVCSDAVAVSTFLCEYYLRLRFSTGGPIVVPVDELEPVLATQTPDVAVNVHSFSECPVAAIEWWLNLLARQGVRHLFIVPNAEDHGGRYLLAKEGDQTRTDIVPLLEARGYRLMAQEPKYRDPAVQKCGVTPTRYYLFSR
jgi:putative sugar O-methyltransferase